jgi:hypothetical protein
MKILRIDKFPSQGFCEEPGHGVPVRFRGSRDDEDHTAYPPFAEAINPERTLAGRTSQATHTYARQVTQMQ